MGVTSAVQVHLSKCEDRCCCMAKVSTTVGQTFVPGKFDLEHYLALSRNLAILPGGNIKCCRYRRFQRSSRSGISAPDQERTGSRSHRGTRRILGCA